MSDRVDCPVCGRWVTKNKTGTLSRHKAKPRWVGSRKLTDEPPSEWCPGGGRQKPREKGLKANQAMVDKYPILQHFQYNHLPPDLADISRSFCTLAWKMARLLPQNAETSTALRKLLEAKDAAVRAQLQY